MKWYPFDEKKGSRQKRSPVSKWVVVKLKRRAPNLPPGLGVGYRKDSAGEKQHPYFVIPGIGGEVVAFCDCLPDDFEYPLEEGDY